MSTDYKAKLVLAVTKSEIIESMGEEFFDEIVENEELQFFQPYCDAEYGSGLFGVEVISTRSYDYKYIDTKILKSDINTIKDQLKKDYPQLDFNLYMTVVWS